MVRWDHLQPLYDAFDQFVKSCLLGDRSLIWPEDQVWTLPNLQGLKDHMIDSPDFGEGSFEEKLVNQMEGLDSSTWKLIADIYYIYFLPSDFITFEKKKHDIKWAADKGGFQVPPENANIWEPLRKGYTRTSMKYHSKYAQFWLVILFAIRVKESNQPERYVEDPEFMQRVLDSILGNIPEKKDRANDMRHALLHMNFPERYESSISTRDKERIVERYDQILDEVPDDLDRAIYRIRYRLPEVRESIDPEFNFYEEEIKEDWREEKSPPKVDTKQLSIELRGDRKDISSDSKGLIKSILSTLAFTRNLILYGPPGTGKTYFANKVAQVIVKPSSEEGISKNVRLQKVADRLTFYELLALAMYLNDPSGRFAVPELRTEPIIQARHELSPVKHPNNQAWGYLQSHSSPASETVQISHRSEPFLFDKDDESCWFLTERGIEYIEENLLDEINYLQNEIQESDLFEFIEWVTFHQSYSYEEFIEGLRPVSSEEDVGDISYQVVPGAFKKIAKKAEVDPENNYVVIIDEINRGNIAKIFGELITLIEDDKRKGEENHLEVALAYSPEVTFSVPNNLYLIGTMNTADRSIALLDAALRRRFAFQEIMPSPELLDHLTVEGTEASVNLGALLRSINQKVIEKVDRDHQIGHSYFLKLAEIEPQERPEMLEFIWNHQVFPLLQEYFYNQPEELFEVLQPMYADSGVTKQELMMGRAIYEFEPLTGDDFIYAMAALVEE